MQSEAHGSTQATTVVYLNLHGGKPCATLDRCMQDTSWRMACGRNISDAWSVIEGAGGAVGLVDLDREVGDADIDQLEKLVSQCSGIRWIALVDKEVLTRDRWRNWIAAWCYDFHTMPIDPLRLRVTIGRAVGMALLDQRKAPVEHEEVEYQMVGASDPMRAVYRSIRHCAVSDAPVLVLGETGTGKELAAKAIHERSARAEGPFVAVNCGALPRELIQSELFGYETGAFTGANRPKKGYIEAATGGTLFLDEIGDLPPELQVHLLRFLQDGLVQRLGGVVPKPVDVRIVAATDVDLSAAVAEGRFREALYYRLNVLRIDMPPLRQREGDPVLLAEFFFQTFRREAPRPLRGFSAAARKALNEHSWPGNVRELINRVRRALVLCPGSVIQVGDLDLEASPKEGLTTLAEARRNAECDMIHRALRTCEDNVSSAARKLGISRSQLYELMRQYEITVDREDVGGEQEERQRIQALLEQYAGNIAAVARELEISRATLYRRMRKLEIHAGPSGSKRRAIIG